MSGKPCRKQNGWHQRYRNNIGESHHSECEIELPEGIRPTAKQESHGADTNAADKCGAQANAMLNATEHGHGDGTANQSNRYG